MAISTTKARGNAKATGTPKTPAPTNFEREASTGYGNNIYPGRAVLDPGQQHVNDLLAPSDEVRNQVIAKGLNTKGDVSNPVNFQIRKLTDANVPIHSAMSKRGPADGSPGATVPAKNGVVQEEPVRQPPSGNTLKL